jgi:hypothetical protein
MRSIRRVMLFMVVASLVGVGVPAAMADATTSPVVPITACGQVITTNAVLHTDLECSGDALTVAASNVTVRLGGHTITSSDGTGSGIRLDAPGDCSNVVIRDGTITGFSNGIAALTCSGTGDRVGSLDLENNMWGIFTQTEIALTVNRTTIDGPNGIGPAGPFTGQVSVLDSIIQVTDPGGVSFATAQSGSNLINGSRLTGGKVLPTSNGFLTISNSRLVDVTILCGDSSLSVTDSRLVGGGVGNGVACGESFVQDRFTGSGSGTAIAISADFESSIVDSSFSGWGAAVQVEQGGDLLSITGNTFQGNGTGVSSCPADCTDSGGTISGNGFLDNTGVGLLLNVGTWHVGSNRALRNGGLGIDAEGSGLTVYDDGGNVALHNQPPQCVGVVCNA